MSAILIINPLHREDKSMFIELNLGLMPNESLPTLIYSIMCHFDGKRKEYKKLISLAHTWCYFETDDRIAIMRYYEPKGVQSPNILVNHNVFNDKPALSMLKDGVLLYKAPEQSYFHASAECFTNMQPKPITVYNGAQRMEFI